MGFVQQTYIQDRFLKGFNCQTLVKELILNVFDGHFIILKIFGFVQSIEFTLLEWNMLRKEKTNMMDLRYPASSYTAMIMQCTVYAIYFASLIFRESGL